MAQNNKGLRGQDHDRQTSEIHALSDLIQRTPWEQVSRKRREIVRQEETKQVH